MCTLNVHHDDYDADDCDDDDDDDDDEDDEDDADDVYRTKQTSSCNHPPTPCQDHITHIICYSTMRIILILTRVTI